MKKNLFSAFLLIVISYLILHFRYLQPPVNVLSWDVFGYYLYLPAIFIHNDLGLQDFSVIDNIIDLYQNTSTFYQAQMGPSGDWVIKYPVGLAILYSPFFFIGHLAAHLMDYPVDGFSLPYQYSIIIGGLVYTILGLFFLRKVLLKLFSEKVTIILLIIVVFGTNYFEHVTYEGIMPHNFLFTLYAIILWLTIRWHESHKLKHAILLGLVIGLTVISRPSEIVCFLIPALWFIKSKASYQKKVQLLKKNRKQVFLFCFAVLVAVLPQLIYWKLFTGNFFYYSYSNPGEGFEFLWPYTFKVLFSFRKGWLLYTPVMIFSIIGFYYLYKRNRKIFYPVFVYFLINLYIVSSWSCWWYAAGYSQRALIQSYPVMIIPLGYFIVWLLNTRKIKRVVIFIIIALMIFLNLFQTWQYTNAIIDCSRMTRAYYWKIFGKTIVTENDRKLLLIDRSYSGKFVIENEENFDKSRLEYLDFEDGDKRYKDLYSTKVSYSGSYSVKLDKLKNFSPDIHKKYKQITDKEYAYIRASAWVYPVYDLNDNPFSLVATFNHNGGLYSYIATNSEDLDNLELNKWHRIEVEMITPEVRSKNDKLYVYIWLRGEKTMYVDDIQVEIFEPRD